MDDILVEKAINIHPVTNKTITITRKDILQWINSALNKDVKRIEELSDGSIYCLLMDQLFPGCIPIAKLKFSPRSEAEAITNYKLLVHAFRELDVRKDVPMESLVKGVFSENFRFGQWFKLFYDANAPRVKYIQPAKDSRCESAPYVHSSPKRSVSVSRRDECSIPRDSNTTLLCNDKRQQSLMPSTYIQPNNVQKCVTVPAGQRTTRQSTEAALGMPRAKVLNPSDMISDEDEHSEPMHENFYDEGSTKKGSSSHLQRTSAAVGRFVPKPSSAHTPGNLTNDQCAGITPSKESPQNFPSQQRKSAVVHSVIHPGAQLPPPSPYPSNQYSSAPSRWTHKPTAGHSWTTSQLFVNTMASGDLPMGPASQDGSSAGKGCDHRGTNSADHRTQHSSCQKSHRIQSHTHDELNRHSAPVSREVLSNPSAILLNKKTPSMASLAVTPAPKSVDTGTQAHPGAHFPQSSVYPRDIHIEDVIPENVIKESELQRQLSVMRFGIFEQRRALFFCQKEAEFYYNKLTKIQDFCYQLKEAEDKSGQTMLDNILGILYESEDGYICAAELDP